MVPSAFVADFFELGGHSILAVELMASVDRVFGRRLPLNAIFGAPTIELLAKQVEEPEHTLGQHTLVSVQATGSRPPVFWIPGGAALGLFRLQHIVKRLGPDQPVYGLGSRPPESLEGIETVEERAERYLALIRRAHPAGPYSFVGFCAGGLVAFEMAQQVTREGGEVSFVGLINSPFPDFPTSRVASSVIRANTCFTRSGRRVRRARDCSPLFARSSSAVAKHVRRGPSRRRSRVRFDSRVSRSTTGSTPTSCSTPPPA